MVWLEAACSRVDGDDLPTTAPHHQHLLQTLGQYLQELHVCRIKVVIITTKNGNWFFTVVIIN